ncbi:acyl-CoA thioesterase FadM [Tamaricihabitans halophyticus]|uniref:Acyl-CoA thioesterase FadM n=1 Tax=Tamaricihabitans halophyticus TaxID=1262583 RepID=A0A4V6NRF9_9PSEU|nr:thioesterase family protein [Tamaricihabitans halophyticus]TCP56466.1 acyl-CoA thioesterase FadM [Tamaricihabitans halophyticus]
MANSEERIVTPYEGTGHRDWHGEAPVPAPLWLHEAPVSPKWVDYNGHMSESCYLLVFGDNSDAFFRYVGIGEEYRASGKSLYTVESHVHNRREVAEGEPLRLSLRLLDHDAKRVHLFHEMWHGGTQTLLATAEQLLVHVDAHAGRSCPIPDYLHERIAAVHRAHAELPVPEVVGRPIAIPKKREGSRNGQQQEAGRR